MSDTSMNATTATPVKAPSKVTVSWAGEHRFDASRPGGPALRMDGSGETGQSPLDALLSALAACSGVDVVDVLAKRRTPVTRLAIDVEGTRRDEYPRRFVKIVMTYHVDGAGIDRVHAERAVQLAFEKYCSVAATLAPDLAVETIVALNGERGSPIAQKIGG